MGKLWSFASSLAIITYYVYHFKDNEDSFILLFLVGKSKKQFRVDYCHPTFLSETIGSVDFQYKERKEEKERMV